jgi:hypothetical protein
VSFSESPTDHVPDLSRRVKAKLRESRGSHAATVADEDGEVVDALSFVRSKLKLPMLTRVVKHGESNAVYDLELEDGQRIPIGPSEWLANPRKVDKALIDGAGVVPQYFGPKQFRPVVRALLAIAETEDTGTTEAEETREWISSFVSETEPVVEMSNPRALNNVLEYRAIHFRGDDDSLYLKLPAFYRHVTLILRANVDHRDLGPRLGRLGFTKRQLSARDGDHVAKGRYWMSPRDFDPDS